MSTDPDVGSVATWRKSRHSMTNGNCVEVAADSNGIMVRDSANRAETTIHYSAEAWQAFLAHARVSECDLYVDLLDMTLPRGPYLQSFVRWKFRYERDGVGPRWSW
jgi:hypothetical protein